MSLESWKKEFYPVEADETGDMTRKQIVEHSLNKWRGLRPINLSEHRLVKNGQVIEDDKFYRLVIASESCSLCQHYYQIESGAPCSYCPIVKVSAKTCYKQYGHWIKLGDPEPMIELLERTLAETED